MKVYELAAKNINKENRLKREVAASLIKHAWLSKLQAKEVIL